MMDFIQNISFVTINGFQLVSGLLWQPLSNPRMYMREAREIGASFDMDIVSVRKGAHYQAGFVSRKAGARGKKMYSLASVLASVYGDHWIGIFSIPDDPEHYALCAVAEGSIVPECDIIASRDEVVSIAIEKTNLYLERPLDMYMPEEFWAELGCSKAADDLSKIITPQSVKQEHKLKPLRFGWSRGEWATAIFIAAVVLAGIYGLIQYRAYVVHKEKVQAAKKAMELAELQRRSQQKMMEEAMAHPWAKQPGMADFLKKCFYTVDRLPLSVAGWAFEKAVCSDNPATVGIRYSNKDIKSTVGNLIAELAKQQVTAAISTDGLAADMQIPLNLTVTGDEELLPVDVRLNTLFSAYQRFGLKLDLSAKEDAAPVLREGMDPNLPIPPIFWRTFSFRASTEIAPAIIFNGLDVTGLRLSKITVSLEQDRLLYQIEGDAYAKK